MIRWFFLLTILTAIPTLGYAQETSQHTEEPSSKLLTEQQHFQKLMTEACKKHKIPSLTIAAVTGEEILVVHCVGTRKRGSNQNVSLADLHPIGSNTKSITAAIAATIVESGKIGWDTTVEEVWPKYNGDKIHPKLRGVTLMELLSNQSGIQPDFEGVEWSSFFDEKKKPMFDRRRMVRTALQQAPKTQQGKFAYSNLGFVVASAMLEKVTSKDFETLAQDNIFDPLEMKSAYFHSQKTAKRLKPPLLWGHDAKGKPINPKDLGSENPPPYAAAGTIHVNVADYAKYIQWHLRQKPNPVLSKQETFDYLHEGMVNVNRTSKYGAGWFHFRSRWGRVKQHAGSNTNSFILAWVLPEKNLAAFAMTNTDEPGHFDACDEMIAEMLKRYANK